MKKATKIVVAVFALIIGGGIMYSIIKTHSGDKVPTYNKSSTDTQKLELLQQLYHKAPDFNHIAIGAYEDGFSGGDLLRNGYVPYEENYKQEDIYSLHGSAHGVSVRVYIKQADTALEANEKMIEEFNQKASEKNYTDVLFGETYTADENTIAIKTVKYLNEKGQSVSAFLYSDIRDEGKAYLCAEIDVNEAEFDDQSEELLEELDVVFGFNISETF
ncbi:MAG: hypothetical protein ACTTKS_02295 [Bulleidia sp.]